MSLNLCPDCKQYHRGRCLVCRPCARDRLNQKIERQFMPRETFLSTKAPVEPKNRVPEIIKESAEG